MWLGGVVDHSYRVATSRKMGHTLGLIEIHPLLTRVSDGYAIVHIFFTEYYAKIPQEIILPCSWLSHLLSFASCTFCMKHSINGMAVLMGNIIHLAHGELPPCLTRGHHVAAVHWTSLPISKAETYEDQDHASPATTRWNMPYTHGASLIIELE